MSRTDLIAAGLIALAMLLFRWYRKHSRPDPERLTGENRLTAKEQALLAMIRLGSHRNADEPAYEDREESC